MKRKQWYRLDSAGKIFPAIVTQRNSTVFRLSATVIDEISPSRLQKALDKTIIRFPLFKVRLKSGVFWHFLQENRLSPVVRGERYAPCRPMSTRRDRHFLFRVLYFEHRISVEFSHTLTDGTGAQQFLLILLQHYLESEEPLSSMIDPTSSPNSKEWEDSYLNYYNEQIPPPRTALGAYHLPKPFLAPSKKRVITGKLLCKDLKNLSKESGVTITEYLVATYLATLQDLNHNNPRRAKLFPLRVMVPVNLRSFYPSVTLRNFFLTVLPGIDLRLGEFSFREILDTVHHYMQVEVNEKYINQQIRFIVGGIAHPFVKWLPLLIKAPFEKLIYRYIATRKHSGVLTNLGLVRLPESVQNKIERFDFIPNPNPVTKCNLGIISYGEWTTITIGSVVKYRDVERLFFTRLKKAGLEISIESNLKE